MGTVAAGRTHLRQGNVEGLARWLKGRKPSAPVRAQLLRDALGMRDTESLRGFYPEACEVLLKSLQRNPLGFGTLQDYWASLRDPRVWTPENRATLKGRVWAVFALLSPKHRPQALDHMLAMALLSGQDVLLEEVNQKLEKAHKLPVSQEVALAEGRYELLQRWLAEGKPLQPTVAALAFALPFHRPFGAWLLEQPAWPGTPEGLFETAVICGMVRAEEEAHKKLAWRLLDWGVAPQGWLEVNPARERYLGHVDKGQLAPHLKHDRLTYVREIPDVRLSMEAEGRLFVQAQWIDAWPTHVAKAVALHRVVADAPAPPSRNKPRF